MYHDHNQIPCGGVGQWHLCGPRCQHEASRHVSPVVRPQTRGVFLLGDWGGVHYDTEQRVIACSETGKMTSEGKVCLSVLFSFLQRVCLSVSCVLHKLTPGRGLSGNLIPCSLRARDIWSIDHAADAKKKLITQLNSTPAFSSVYDRATMQVPFQVNLPMYLFCSLEGKAMVLSCFTNIWCFGASHQTVEIY